MESASEAPPTMAGGEATCDPSLSSGAPPPPPPSSSASTKRRWSPCTWRYAIEEAQTELPSRPRATTVPFAAAVAAAPPSSSRALPASGPSQPTKTKPPHHNPTYGKAAEEPPRSSHAPRAHPSAETRVRSTPSQQPVASKSRTEGEGYRLSNRKSQPLHPSIARVSEEEEEEEEEELEQDDHDDGGGGDGLAVYDEEYFKRRRREMSPSELYFCGICSAKGIIKGIPCPYDLC